jgi:prepilin-type N-terminal cleavage/methylation domain-containing protein
MKHIGLQFNIKDQRGLTLIEMLVVFSLIALLSIIGLQTYDQFRVKSRDNARVTTMYQLSNKLELFYNDHGYYPCGDACVNVNGPDDYSIDHSNSGVAGYFGNDECQAQGFLNGGNCCGGYPVATTTEDDTTWGLYCGGYMNSNTVYEPLNNQKSDGNYRMYYRYGTPSAGRNSFSLSVVLEASDLDKEDEGRSDYLFEIYSNNYPSDGYVSGGS